MARVKDCFYLLLEDVKGLEPSNPLLRVKIPVTVKKGELVTPCREPVIVSKSHHTHNYRLSRDPSVTLYCMEQEIVVVNDYEFKLLEAIRTRKDRYKVYCNGLFEWGAKLKVNDKIMVKLPSKSRSGASLKFSGVVRYVGALTDNLGFWFGVKIKKEDYRDCDFSNSEQHYIYHDDKQHTVIVSLDKLRMLPTINNNGDVESVIDHQTETTTSDENTFAATQDEPHQLEEESTNHSHTPHQVGNLAPHQVDNLAPHQVDNLAPHQVDSYPDASLEVQSRVQVPSSVPGEEYQYGVIRWIGPFRNGKELFAGIELDEKTFGCTDGTHRETRKKYFKCPSGRGIYYPLRAVMHDARFMDHLEAHLILNPLEDVKELEVENQTLSKDQIQKYIGNQKGIQGHHNSCFIDATLFGLFAVSTEFDEPFLGEFGNHDQEEISHLLWRGIVNPLRKNQVVKLDSVVKLRDKLDKIGRMRGITQEEKDPEEFLNMLFKYTLQVSPFISIRRPFGVEQEYFVQLFLEPDASLKLPSVGYLLDRMFQEQSISFTEVPAKLLIQVPRFGRQFKTFQAIIAEPVLNIGSLVDGAGVSAHKCTVCGQPAKKVCDKCILDEHQNASPYFCNNSSCWTKDHTTGDGDDHKGQFLCDESSMCRSEMYEMELLSVICIETSHYVCFTRSEDQWVFFDSMANRVYDKFNIPKVVDCSSELKKWVFPADGVRAKLENTHPRNLPEYVRRFTQDVYLCVYVRTMCILKTS